MLSAFSVTAVANNPCKPTKRLEQLKTVNEHHFMLFSERCMGSDDPESLEKRTLVEIYDPAGDRIGEPIEETGYGLGAHHRYVELYDAPTAFPYTVIKKVVSGGSSHMRTFYLYRTHPTIERVIEIITYSDYDKGIQPTASGQFLISNVYPDPEDDSCNACRQYITEEYLISTDGSIGRRIKRE